MYLVRANCRYISLINGLDNLWYLFERQGSLYAHTLARSHACAPEAVLAFVRTAACSKCVRA